MTKKEKQASQLTIVCIIAAMCLWIVNSFLPSNEPGAEVAPTEAPVLTDFSSPSSEVASDESATFISTEDTPQ